MELARPDGNKERTMSSFEIGATRPVGAVQVEQVNPASQSTTSPAEPAGAAATTGTGEVQTSLSTTAGTVPVDQTRVEQIRDAVNKGSYPLIPAKIGDAMIAAGMMLRKAR